MFSKFLNKKEDSQSDSCTKTGGRVQRSGFEAWLYHLLFLWLSKHYLNSPSFLLSGEMRRAGTMHSGPPLWLALRRALLNLILIMTTRSRNYITAFLWTVTVFVRKRLCTSFCLPWPSLFIEVHPHHMQKSLCWFNDSVPASSKIL